MIKLTYFLSIIYTRCRGHHGKQRQ